MNKTTKKLQQFIIFGATGDLASLMLFPALYELFVQNQLPENFQIIGYGRSAMPREEFLKKFEASVKNRSKQKLNKLEELLKKVEYFSGQYDQESDFRALDDFLKKMAKGKAREVIAYFSVPPVVFGPIVDNLAATVKKSAKKIKLVLEKPFGTDEKSAEKLLKEISRFYDQSDIYLLDHYLGKRPIQSILKLRMENNVINLMIKGQEISRITILALEKNDVGQRVGYYDQVGAMKDMMQSHLLQILALITMDIPVKADTESLRREKSSILSAVRFSGKAADVVFAQYKSYQKLEGIVKNSKIDTYAELKLQIDRRDWYEVPVHLITGKKLDQDLTKVIIEFKKMPIQSAKAASNFLIFEIKPHELVKLALIQRRTDFKNAKVEAYESVDLEQGLMCQTDFCLGPYASLINDVILGEKRFFLSFEEILSAWKVIDKVEKVRSKSKLLYYEDGSSGPKRQN
ncbi:hypothetical protein IT411_03455 [Candidatus Peregrinibacteria bacterium]|nr:hypothetical protein [Candidatus Peregrinibacteria bacterium]